MNHTNHTVPGFPHFHYQQQQLYVEQVCIKQLAEQYGTPLYIYSKAAITETVTNYTTALGQQKHLICYSVKANSNIAILQQLAQLGCGFDIVSGGELQRVLAAGVDARHIVFSGVGKTKAEMKLALQAHIKCFNVESIPEIDLLAQTAQELGVKAPISLRINPDIDAKTHPYISTALKGNKFGVAFDQALETYIHAAQNPYLDVQGIDCHLGSQITEMPPYLEALDRLAELIGQLAQNNIPIHHLDLGGGLGITYEAEAPPTPQVLYAQIIHRLKQHQLEHLELIVEPGRSIVGNSGALITQALYLKPGEEKNFCIVDAAMNDLARPALYNAYHHMQEVCTPPTSAQATLYDVVGPICESGDWLGRDRKLTLKPNDYLAIFSAGAYGMTMSSNYNSRPKAAELLIDSSHIHLIRERETLTDLYAKERLIK